MDKFFEITEKGSSVRTEMVAGFTTFFTMAYIMFVNPSILSESGMPWSGVFVATILAAIVGTLIMAFVANVPYAVAPGMGLNAFFTYTVCFGFGFAWQEALAMVFICGLINILMTVTKVRKNIIRSIPKSLQLAIGGGIGLFIAYIGIKNAGFINFASTSEGFTLGAAVVPSLSNFSSPGPLLAFLGLVITVILMIRNVKGALLIGIIMTTLIGIPMGVTTIPDQIFNLEAVSDFQEVSFAFFGDPGLKSLFGHGAAMIPIVLITIFSFSLSDTFDTIGTFIGTGRRSGIFDEADEKALIESKGFKSRMDRALFADATATSLGALFGTSNTTTYVESAAGIGVGGRTGFTALVVAALFLLCLPFASLFGIVPAEATAPALIVVGILMVEAFADIRWKELEEAIPAFFTIVIMSFAYNISWGIAAGFIFYCIVKICKKQMKDVHPIIIGATLLFLLNFILMAVHNI
ncbi:MAG: NCS2 family permease [Methanomicrobiales archaeon]|jgi:AGZA family xanthine/uracil permease-like MFS transporter|nr:NCS2 family permease [Methanomicrobiales archaeon]